MSDWVKLVAIFSFLGRRDAEYENPTANPKIKPIQLLITAATNVLEIGAPRRPEKKPTAIQIKAQGRRVIAPAAIDHGCVPRAASPNKLINPTPTPIAAPNNVLDALLIAMPEKKPIAAPNSAYGTE
jgi:hypothetical protein